MSNLVVYREIDGKIIHFIKDAVKCISADGIRCDYFGDGQTVTGVKVGRYAEKWTDDIVNPTYDASGNFTGYDSAAPALGTALSPGLEIQPQDVGNLHKRKKRLVAIETLDINRIDDIVTQAMADPDKMKKILKILILTASEVLTDLRSRNV